MVASRILADGKTPAEWKEQLAAKGIDISERKLRERARAIGACGILGKAMILLPEHIDQIFEAPECRSKSISGTESGGSVDDLLMETITSEEALRHLTKKSQKPKSVLSRQKRGNIVSLDRMRLSQRS